MLVDGGVGVFELHPGVVLLDLRISRALSASANRALVCGCKWIGLCPATDELEECSISSSS